jgi:hypothetical protein
MLRPAGVPIGPERTKSPGSASPALLCCLGRDPQRRPEVGPRHAALSENARRDRKLTIEDLDSGPIFRLETTSLSGQLVEFQGTVCEGHS